MKILFVSPSYKPAYVYGGPAVSVSELAEALVAAGNSVTVYTTTANGKTELDVEPATPVMLNGVTVYYFKRQTGDHTHISYGLWRRLWNSVSSYDVIHLQSWWSLLIIGAAAICRMRKVNFVVSPRGMLSSYSFQTQHSLVKKLIHRAVGLSLLRKSRLHATTLLEWNDCMHVNSSWKGFILPNIIRFPEAIVEKPSVVSQDDMLTFGFLSRIDPKKGLELLFHALAQVNFNYKIRIAGSGDENYVASLKNLSDELGLTNRIEWCGWKNGDEKFEFLRSIDIFVLTSYNENFANTVLESLVIGTPVFLSNGVGLANYIKENSLGWTCDTDIISIAECLRLIYSQRDRLLSMQKLAPHLIKKDFSKENLAREYETAYRKIA